MLKKAVNLMMVAPMMGWTTRHYRYFMRLISKKVMLYTEMITTSAILHGLYRDRLLTYHCSEQPLAVQLGGHRPCALAQAAKIAEDYGYTEINLNVGCPSVRAQSGCFGAVLLKNADLVAECIAAMRVVVQVPLTIKTRLGVDNDEDYDYLAGFIRKVSQAGCRTFIVHARKAWLSGLNPKENRQIPPLNYAWVYQIKKDFPQLTIVINGGIQSLEDANTQLLYVDGAMIGRAAWYNPYLFRGLDVLPDKNGARSNIVQDKLAIVQHYIPYAQAAFSHGEALGHLLQPLFGLFYGVVGAAQWRKGLAEVIQRKEPPDSALPKMLKKFSADTARVNRVDSEN